MGARARAVLTVEEGDSPLFSRIARGIADDIRRGRLRAGESLPGTRALADSLGVNRNTVVAAYSELLAEGWAITRAGNGTFVADDIPLPSPRSFSRRARPTQVAREAAFSLHQDPALATPTPHPRGTIVMAGGVPDVRLLPGELLSRALRRVLMSRTGTETLRYGEPRGDKGLRAAVADLVRETRGVPAREDDVVIVRGSQMGLDLIARAVLPPGSAIAVEAIGYRPAWTAFQRAGHRLVPVPVDEQGLDVDALEELARIHDIRAVYVTPHHQYPTTVTLAPARRLALLTLAERARFAIIEDDYDHELHYEGRPIMPLASADSRGSVIYIGTLSKVLAPGLRLGYVVASPPVLERIARERFVIDRQGDHLTERAVADLMEDGSVARHVRRVRAIYGSRRDLLIEELRRAFGDRIAITPPTGGLALWAWVRLRASEVVTWELRAKEQGVVFVAGERLHFDGRPLPYARFGFAPLDDGEIREAVRRLVRAFPA